MIWMEGVVGVVNILVGHGMVTASSSPQCQPPLANESRAQSLADQSEAAPAASPHWPGLAFLLQSPARAETRPQ